MKNGQSGSVPAVARGDGWPTAVASLAVGAAFFLVVLVIAAVARLPCGSGGCSTLAMAGCAPVSTRIRCRPALRLGFRVDGTRYTSPDWTAPESGCGRPLPPRVRNPMYEGFAVGWIGLWVIFGHASLVAIAAASPVALAVHLFVLFYEEPTLRKKFGVGYDSYCQNVNRWWPRVRGWDQPQIAV